MDTGLDYEDWGQRFLKRMRQDDNKVDLESRQGFAEWMCRQHNIVNKEKGKQMFDCSFENLKMRWGPVEKKP